MVGNHPVRRAELASRVVGPLRQIGDRLDQRHEEIGLVVGLRVLQHRRKPLETGSGVDRGPRQRTHLPGGVTIVLHEHEVPDLDDVVAIAVDQFGATGRQRIGATVEVDLGARTAGPGLAHRPEVVLLTEAEDPVRRCTCGLPQLHRVVVVGVDGEPETIHRQTVDIDHQLPRVLDGVFLEVVAKGEVAEHLEKGVVTRGVTHVFQVVVLAAGAHALLGRAGAGLFALFAPREHLFELVHPSVGEKQGAVAGRQQRTRGHHLVPLGGEVVEKGLSNFLTGHRAHRCGSPGKPPVH